MFGMSRSAFSAKFQDLIGETVLRYITRWRINQATSYLLTTQSKLPEIAARVGYESEGSFSKVFKKYVGMTPSAYRQASAPNVSAKRFSAAADTRS